MLGLRHPVSIHTKSRGMTNLVMSCLAIQATGHRHGDRPGVSPEAPLTVWYPGKSCKPSTPRLTITVAPQPLPGLRPGRSPLLPYRHHPERSMTFAPRWSIAQRKTISRAWGAASTLRPGEEGLRGESPWPPAVGPRALATEGRLPASQATARERSPEDEAPRPKWEPRSDGDTHSNSML